MSIYTKYLPQMNSIVDEVLGDDIFYAAAGTDEFLPVRGFFLLEDRDGYVPDVDELSVAEQVKVAKADVPEVRRGDRIKRSLTSETTYQPYGDKTASAGDYWVFNIQEA